MHILFLTWKDSQHPNAGGAEKVMHEYAKGLIEAGHRVTWFASEFSQSTSREDIDGINIIRHGTSHTLWFTGWWWYRTFLKDEKPDIIIDEAGGWPLLSPIFTKNIPIYFFLHHVGDSEFESAFFPFNHILRFVYRSIIKIYKKVPTITVSQSTKNELLNDFGFIDISILENATDIIPLQNIDRGIARNDVVFIGRLTRIKHPDHAIQAFIKCSHKLAPETRLHIIGQAQDSEFFVELQSLVSASSISKNIQFHGHIERSEFASILLGCRAILVPSEKEGFGLVVRESNSFGVPAIAYDVPGLSESVSDGKNGILVPYGDIVGLSTALEKLFANESFYRTISENALQFVKNAPTWKMQQEKFNTIIIPPAGRHSSQS